jgi:hypothetical protein
MQQGESFIQRLSGPKKTYKAVRLTFITAIALILLTNATSVMVSSAPSTLTIAPAQLDLTLRTGQPKVQKDIELRNDSLFVQSVSLSAIDISNADEYGNLVFLDTQTTDVVSKYGIANWLSLPSQPISIQPGAVTTFTATINDRSDLSPGAHYGAILISKQDPASSKADNVPFKVVLSDMVFLVKEGAIIQGLELKEWSVSKDWRTSPKVDLRFYNSGNTFAVPRGYITLADPLGHQIARTAINQDSVRIFPETYRHLTESLATIASSWVPGWYRLSIEYRYDGENVFHHVEGRYWYVQIWHLLIIGVILLTTIFIIWKFRHWSRPRRRRHKSVA